MLDILPHSADDSVLSMQRYELTEEDYIAYNLHVHYTAPHLKRKRIRTWLLLILLCAAASWLFHTNGQRSASHGSLIFAVITLLFYPWYAKNALIKYFKRQVRAMYSEQIGKTNDLVLRESHCELKTPTAYTRMDYSHFTSFLEGELFYLLQVGKLQSYIVPKRCIQDEDRWRKSLQHVAQLHGIETQGLSSRPME